VRAVRNNGETIDLEAVERALPRPPLDPRASEEQLAAELEKRLPPVRCAGEEWYVYRDGVWRQQSRHALRPEAMAVQDPSSRQARKAAAILQHLESEAQCDPDGFQSFCALDAGGAVLVNCQNGVLRVTPQVVDVLPHAPDYLFTGQLAAAYRSEAECPTFEAVLQYALPDPADIELFRLFCGYLLLPDCRFETALVCYGPGGTGKGTLAHGVESALGPELVRHLSLEQICDPKTKMLAQLRHKAVNVATELNALQTVGGETFKQLVSGERVQADRKYLADVSLQTGCKHWFLTNYLPRFQHGTDAELRRLRFLRMDRKPERADVTLKAKVAAERDGIFVTIMLAGLRALLQRADFSHGGEHSRQCRERFKLQNDPLGAFLEERCELRAGAAVVKDDLYAEYEAFCQDNGIPPAEQTPFFRQLYERHPLRPGRGRAGGKRLQRIRGLRLKEDAA
jgi:P4 family phage/plasmid primase-like protien